MIDINNESGVSLDDERVLRLVQHHLAALHVSSDADLAVMFVDEGTMEQLHLQWMNEPGPTDVLSFPMDELRPGAVDRPTEAGVLGDIVVCPQVAEVQAETAGHSVMDEICLLTTHGMLHVLGYDHALPDEERHMFGLQRELLTSFAVQERRRRRA